MANGNFVISLDFELYWGVRDVIALDAYKENLLGVRKVIPGLLDLFEKYGINATFATVGFLFFDNRQELEAGLPEVIPQYSNPVLSPYISHISGIGENEQADKFHFAPSLIELIHQAKQEIGSHTFSHYYSLEHGQNIEAFKADIIAAKKIAAKKNIDLKTFVFPRNQFTDDHLKVLRDEGFIAYRGNEPSWLFSSLTYGRSLVFRRPFRLLDAYLNLSGHNCYSNKHMKKGTLVDIPSSRFLRPVSDKLSRFENMRLNRIRNSMTYAAKEKLTYHLWWHPHNFGANTTENLAFLEKILVHFKYLSDKYDYRSSSMLQLAEHLIANDE